MLDVVVHGAQLAVGLCFGWAAVSKLAAFGRFEQGVASFEILAPRMVKRAAMAVVRLALLGTGVAVVVFDALAGSDAQAFSWAALVTAGCIAVGCTALTDASDAFAVAIRGPRRRSPKPRLERA